MYERINYVSYVICFGFMPRDLYFNHWYVTNPGVFVWPHFPQNSPSSGASQSVYMRKENQGSLATSLH